MLTPPRLSASLVCCHECGQRVPYRLDGTTERHDVAGGLECPAGFPRYVSGISTADEAPMPLHAALELAVTPAPPDPAAPYSILKSATVGWQPW